MTDAADKISSRELFHATCAGMKFDRPPFWMMRQAGRYLPEYRKLKEAHGFLGIVKTPEVGVEAALQPMRRFDFDCAILFSDILVVAEALGFPYRFKDGGGIAIDNPISGIRDVEKIPEEGRVSEKLDYVRRNLEILRAELPAKAIFGFCGSPFTIAAYMVEGGSSRQDFPKFKAFIKNEPGAFDMLMEKLTTALCEYAGMQVSCGIDAFQVFDSHAALTPCDEYGQFSGAWISEILKSIDGRARTAVFAGGMSRRFAELMPIGADIYSMDGAMPLSTLLNTWEGRYALQGNLDPSALVNDTPEEVARKTTHIISDMNPYGRHIFNLGHGITPDAKIENVEAMCEAVKNYGRL